MTSNPARIGTITRWRNIREDTELSPSAVKETAPDKWYSFEIVAVGNKIAVFVDGRFASFWTEPTDNPLMLYKEGVPTFRVERGTVKFRKVEYKDLSVNAGKTIDKPSADGFLSLFNGKDLTGWRMEAKAPEGWSVEAGVLTNRSIASGNLNTVREDYADFHLRVRAKVSAYCDAGVQFRQTFGSPVMGYEAQLSTTPEVPHKTGTLFKYDPLQVLVTALTTTLPPEKWFDLEVIAVGERIRLLVDGKEVANYRDREAIKSGGVTLQRPIGDRTSFVQFQKIEIKELDAGGKPLSVLPPVNPAPATAGPDTRVQWEHSYGTGATAITGVFRRVGEKTWCESTTWPKSQELYWFTETHRTADYVELVRPNGGDFKMFVRLHSDRCVAGTTADRFDPPMYSGSWSTKSGVKPTLDLKELSGWRFGLPKQVEVGEEGLILTAMAGENSLLTARDDFADTEIRASISASKGTEALFVFRASNSGGWKAVASSVFDKDGQIHAGMQSNLTFDEHGIKRQRVDFDRPFDLAGTLKDKTLWMKVNTVTTSGVSYGGGRFCPVAGSGGIVVKGGSVTIRSVVVRDVGK